MASTDDNINANLKSRLEAFKTEKLISSVLQKQKETMGTLISTAEKLRSITDKKYQTAKLEGSLATKLLSQKEAILQIAEDEAIASNASVKANAKLIKTLEKHKERQDKLNAVTDKFKNMWEDVTEVIQDPKMAGGLFAIAMGNELGKINGKLMETKDNLSLSHEQAYSLGPALASANIQGALLGVSSKMTQGAMEGMSESMHRVGQLTGNQVAQVAKLSKSLGVSAKEAGNMVGHMMLVGNHTVESAKASLKLTSNLAKAAGLPVGKVMKDVASNMELTSKFGNISVKELGKMAVEAAKLGTSLSEMSALGDKLVDIDAARNDAMQLSVLLGRSVNVDKAQQLMYAGKTGEAHKELLSQLGGIDAFNKMDYYQKKAAADMMGITTGKLEQQLNLSAGLNKEGKKKGWLDGKLVSDAVGYGKVLKDNAASLMATGNLLKSLSKNAGGFFGGLKDAGSGAKRLFKAFKGGGFKGMKTAMSRMGGGGGLMKKVTGTGGEAVDKAKGMGDKLKGVKGTGKEGNVISRFFDAFKKVDWSSILKAIVGMAGMGIALYAFVPPFRAFAEIPVNGILAGIGTLLAMTLAMKVMGKATGSILKGSIAMGILGLALIPAAYAFGLLGDVDPMAMLAFSGSLIILGLAAAGLGFLIGPILMGSIALLAVGLAIIPAAKAFGMLAGVDAESMIGFGLGVGALGIGLIALGTPLALLGILGMKGLSLVLPGFTGALGLIPQNLNMIEFATGVGLLGIAGIMLIPAAYGFGLMAIAMTAFAASLLLLVPLLPVISVLGRLGMPGFGGGEEGGGGSGGKDGGSDEILDKLDELISVIRLGGKIEMDGKAVGKVIQLASGPIGT